LYVEQQIRVCEVCGRPFAIRYGFPAGAGVLSTTVLVVRGILCPYDRCAHTNPALVPFYGLNPQGRPIPAATREKDRVTANRVRELLLTTRRLPGRTAGHRPKNQAKTWLPTIRVLLDRLRSLRRWASRRTKAIARVSQLSG